jgi:hypothetical protein
MRTATPVLLLLANVVFSAAVGRRDGVKVDPSLDKRQITGVGQSSINTKNTADKYMLIDKQLRNSSAMEKLLTLLVPHLDESTCQLAQRSQGRRESRFALVLTLCRTWGGSLWAIVACCTITRTMVLRDLARGSVHCYGSKLDSNIPMGRMVCCFPIFTFLYVCECLSMVTDTSASE